MAALVEGFFPGMLKFGNVFVHGSLCCRRSLLDTYSYDDQYRFAQDYDLFIRLIQSYAKVTYVLEPLYQLRESAGSISQARAQEQLEATRKIARSHFGNDSWLVAGQAGPRRTSLQICRRLWCGLNALRGAKRIQVV